MSTLKPLLLSVLLLFTLTRGTQAASKVPVFVVNSTLDKPDAKLADGMCETAVGNGECTLRAAIMEANNTTGATILVPAGIYTLTLPPVYPWYIPSWFGHLEIVRPMTIAGVGPDKTIIDGNRDVIGEAVMVVSGISNTVVISGVTIQNGVGGIINGGKLDIEHVVIQNHAYSHMAATPDNVYACGGICNTGVLTVSNSVVRHNEITVADNPDPHYIGAGGYGTGGGISSSGPYLAINNSVISNNTVSASVAYGGGVYSSGLYPSLYLAIDNSVISNNTVSASVTYGGGIYSQGSVSIHNSTISSNTVTGSGGGLYSEVTLGYQPLSITLAHISGSTFFDNSARGPNSSGGGLYIMVDHPFCGRICLGVAPPRRPCGPF